MRAFDFIEKPFDDERLFESISAAIERGRQQRIEHDERGQLEARAAELSPRQIEVMTLVAEGLSNKEIAIRLNIRPRKTLLLQKSEPGVIAEGKDTRDRQR